MAPENLSNNAKVGYFPMEEYIKRIHLEKSVLEHMEETNQCFDEYMQFLKQFDDYAIITFWISSFFKELVSSYKIENEHLVNFSLLDNYNLFFDSLNISHARIQRLHNFVLKSTGGEIVDNGQYRKTEVRVSKMTNNGEFVFWHGVNGEDVKRFMDDFVKIYKSRSLSVLNTNPFFKAALMHLLFIRIHPFRDGNGRTGRLLHGMSFTNSINEIYGMKLRISPLNISPNILINKPTYALRIDSIYFDLEHECNEEINKWFDFILDMVDEQLYYNMSQRERLDTSLNNIEELSSNQIDEIRKLIQKMNIK